MNIKVFIVLILSVISFIIFCISIKRAIFYYKMYRKCNDDDCFNRLGTKVGLYFILITISGTFCFPTFYDIIKLLLK
jgi:hypothetical protein